MVKGKLIVLPLLERYFSVIANSIQHKVLLLECSGKVGETKGKNIEGFRADQLFDSSEKKGSLIFIYFTLDVSVAEIFQIIVQ